MVFLHCNDVETLFEQQEQILTQPSKERNLFCRRVKSLVDKILKISDSRKLKRIIGIKNFNNKHCFE